MAQSIPGGLIRQVPVPMRSMRNKSLFEKPWKSYPIISLDLETSGPYPISDDICELAALKWVNGHLEDKFQTLVRPPRPMSDFIVGIHGITNEMVQGAPSIQEVLPQIWDFLKEGIVVGHHSPFDVGFLAHEFEKHQLPLPVDPVLCSSLVARQVITGVANHKLQTLVQHLGIEGGQAHRALDDAQSCWEVLFHCIEKKKVHIFQDIFTFQGEALWWDYFSVRGRTLQSQLWKTVVGSIEEGKDLEIIYDGGSFKGQKRRVHPISVVLNPRGDFLVAQDWDKRGCGEEVRGPAKRFYFKNLREAESILCHP